MALLAGGGGWEEVLKGDEGDIGTPESGPSSLLLSPSLCFLVPWTDQLCSRTPFPRHDVLPHPEPKSNRSPWLWPKAPETVSQNKYCLFLNWLSQVSFSQWQSWLTHWPRGKSQLLRIETSKIKLHFIVNFAASPLWNFSWTKEQEGLILMLLCPLPKGLNKNTTLYFYIQNSVSLSMAWWIQ